MRLYAECVLVVATMMVLAVSSAHAARLATAVPNGGPTEAAMGTRHVRDVKDMGMDMDKRQVPYLDSKLPIPERIEDLLQRMQLDDKVAQLLHIWGTTKPAILQKRYRDTSFGAAYVVYGGDHANCTNAACAVNARNALQKEYMASSRLGIPISFVSETLHGGGAGGTVFPMPITQGSAWNVSMVESIANVVAREARIVGADRGFSPEINVCTDPRFGRTEENFGADPTHVSDMGVAAVRGLQQDRAAGPDTYLPTPAVSVVAEAKHYAAYGFGGKDGYPADLSEEHLFDLYLRPWRAAVSSAGLRAVMAAHNSVNGEPCHSSRRLLTEVLREGFGFGGGLLASDYGNIPTAVGFHTAHNVFEAAGQALNAGVDQDLGATAYREHIPDLVHAGIVSSATLDRAVRNVLRAKFAAGLFEQPMTDPTRVAELDKDRALARDAARQGAVLLRNDGGFLPLDLGGAVKSVALIGPLASCGTEETQRAAALSSSSSSSSSSSISAYETYCAAQNGMNGGYTHGGAHIVTAHEALLGIDGLAVEYAFGASPNNASTEHVAHALAAAARADVVIAVLGDSSAGWRQATCGEDEDRASLDFPGAQLYLLDRLAMDAAVAKKLVVVHVGGRPATFGRSLLGEENYLLAHIRAVLTMFRPGEEGGNALVDLLRGVHSPSGRLAAAWPRSAGHVRSPSTPWFQLFQGSYQNETYALNHPQTPLFPFGFGLSYANIMYHNMTVAPTAVKRNESFSITVTLSNTGGFAQPVAHVVQTYFRQNVSSIVRFQRMLLAHDKVWIAPRETMRVTLQGHASDLGFYNRNRNGNGEEDAPKSDLDAANMQQQHHTMVQSTQQRKGKGKRKSTVSDAWYTTEPGAYVLFTGSDATAWKINTTLHVIA